MALELGPFGNLRKIFPRRLLRKTADAILHQGHKVELDSDSLANLNLVKDALARDPKMNFVGYFNHNAYADPGLSARIFWDHIDPKRTRHLVVPASDWHTHAGNNPSFAHFVRLAATMEGFDIIPIVQAYMVGDERYINFRTGLPYTEADKEQINKASSKHLMRMRKAGPTAVVLAPEETRGALDVLQEAKPGIESMARTMSPCVVVPMGIEFVGDHDRGLNLRSTVKIHVPEPFFIEGREGLPTVDDYMFRLAGALPAHLRGTYVDPGSQNAV